MAACETCRNELVVPRPDEIKALQEKLNRVLGEFIMQDISRPDAINKIMRLIKQELEKQKK